MADQKYIGTIELEDHIDAGRILKRAMAHLLESDRDRRCGFEMALLSKAYRDVQYPHRTSGSAQPRVLLRIVYWGTTMAAYFRSLIKTHWLSSSPRQNLIRVWNTFTLTTLFRSAHRFGDSRRQPAVEPPPRPNTYGRSSRVPVSSPKVKLQGAFGFSTTAMPLRTSHTE